MKGIKGISKDPENREGEELVGALPDAKKKRY